MPTPTIEIKRGKATRGPRYCQDVFIDGAFVGYFRPSAYGTDYTFLDRAKQVITWRSEKWPYNRYIEAETLTHMLGVILNNLKRIPSPAQILQRTKTEQAEKKAREAETAEDARIWQIKTHGPDLLAALEVMVELFAPHQTVDETTTGETVPTAGGAAIDKARAAIEEATKTED